MKAVILSVFVIVLAITGCGQSDQCLDAQARDSEAKVPAGQLPDSLQPYGAQGALSRDNFTLADMLTFAIQDEHLAEAEYLDILERHGDITPFSNIVHSERRHIEALEPLFEQCGAPVPPNEGAAHLIPAETVREALEACIEGEINNIEMYRVFLEQEDVPGDVREVFASLKAASEQHLEAFQRRLGNM